MKANKFRDIEYDLSYPSENTEILRTFLERGLVDVNKIFESPNRGDTMLDNAIRYNNEEMIRLLKQWGL
ncbi:T3SS effector OspC family protein [Sodalis ligni]|uniref:ankyrin repeat domain-containing protein n=1 Tax=Sodalis ligni TaxID=2697027 RepID=UPI00193FFD2F|nr:T3SS effector OspC family protein [Sodalis ligni]QWA09665.1 T3SS effector OspC family protein [Sodalis ligni]